eukprot:CAMPEP_0168791702 /NCGR_PEP_ID=MMETSP0725-20121227/14127_1 /TAXON_ID=265536 /ORGANISM="Amphiprora sp., Strain CCMP467" /LENGTH=140 /DNA_ID=CAMNT_0008842297 /DNA_START=160 /DNA_END=578 /DNA_ORIENTATION=+
MVLHTSEDWVVATVHQTFENQSWTPPSRELVEPVYWASWCFSLMVVMETTLCLSQLRRIWHEQGPAFHSLYRRAWWANVVNHFVMGPITYHVTMKYICQRQQQKQQQEQVNPYTSWVGDSARHVSQFLGMLMVYNLLYYA